MKRLFLFTRDTKGPGYVPNNQIFAYASGLTGQNIAYGYVSGWLRYFCINILHIDSLKVGSIFSASYVWDAINDPVVGAYVDRRKYKPYYKLRPYLLWCPPLIGVLIACMFFDVNFSENGKVIYILLLYFAFDLIYSFQDVGLWGMIALSSPHSEERSRVAQWVSIGAGAGGAVVGLFQMLRSTLIGAGIRDMTVFLIFGFVFGLGGELISMNAYRIRELVATDPPKEESVWQSLSVIRHNRTLLLICSARLAQEFSLKVQNAYFFENCTHYVIGGKPVSGQNAEFFYGLFGGIPGAAAQFFANKIAAKIGGMKRILLISQSLAILIRVVTFFIGYDSIPKFIIMTLLISLVNLPGSLMDIAHRSLTSDSIDELALNTGLRTEGVSLSMQNFTRKMRNGATTLIEGILLKRLGYDSFRKEQGLPQSETFLKWQWPMFCLGPVVGAILYLIIISFVKDDKDRRAEVERQLKERRAAAQELTAGEVH